MIISASRRTDIPSYYLKWFLNRIKEQYVYVRNPMNNKQISKISLSPEVVDCIVLWSKNPEPMLPYLDELIDYNYYFQFTLNSYSQDIEANLPPKSDKIINTFKRLSDKIGKEKVIWRYDPILLNDKYTVDYHTKHFEIIAKQLSGYTDKCTISFVDYYRKISTSLKENKIEAITTKRKNELAKNLSQITFSLGLYIDTCAEDIDLKKFGISHAKCIDAKLIERIIGSPIKTEKDKNQRPICGCVSSIDIGAYNTCLNGCKYCYANHSQSSIKKNISKHNIKSPILIGEISKDDIIKERVMKSLVDRQIRFDD